MASDTQDSLPETGCRSARLIWPARMIRRHNWPTSTRCTVDGATGFAQARYGVRRTQASAPLMHPRSQPGLSPPGLRLRKLLVLLEMLAGSTGLEPAASGVTGRRSNQLNYDPKDAITRIGELETPTLGVDLIGRYRIRTCDSRRVKPVLYH